METYIVSRLVYHSVSGETAGLERLSREDPLAFITAFVSDALRKEWGVAINTIMYISGKDAARKLSPPGRAGSLEEAIGMLNEMLGGHWGVRVAEKGGKRYAIFTECMLRKIYIKAGLRDGKPLPFCYFHAGFVAGMLEGILGRQVDLKPVSRGAESCLEELLLE